MLARKNLNLLAFCLLLSFAIARAPGQATTEYEKTLPGCEEVDATECEGAAVAGGFGALTSALDRVTIADVWKTNNFQRGKLIEQCLGLSPGMASSPDIDKFVKGVITSIKSVDLNLPTYSDPNTLYNKLEGFIDTLKNYKSGSYRGITGNITGRELELVFPSCSGTAAQNAAIKKALAYAKKWKVDVIIKKVVSVNVPK